MTLHIEANGAIMPEMTTTKRHAKPKLTDAERHARFKEVAREVGAEGEAPDFDRTVERLAKLAMAPKPGEGQGRAS